MNKSILVGRHKIFFSINGDFAMKKIFQASLLTVAMFGSLSYATYSWISPTRSVINKLTDADLEYTSQYGGAYKVKYIPEFEELRKDLGATIERDGSYFKIYNRSLTKGGYEGECVSLVKALTYARHSTDEWKPGPQVGVDNMRPGRAIAAFNSYGEYAGHAAILLSQDSEGITVFDQNWLKDGKVAIHKIKFKILNKGRGDGDINNAYSYFIIK